MCPVKSKSDKNLHKVSGSWFQDRLVGRYRDGRTGRVVNETESHSARFTALSKSKRLRSGDRVQLLDDRGRRTGNSATLEYRTRKEAGKYGIRGWNLKNYTYGKRGER